MARKLTTTVTAPTLTTYTIEFFLSTDDDNHVDCRVVWAELAGAGLVATQLDSDHFYGMDKFGAIVFETAQTLTQVKAVLALVSKAISDEITLSEGNRLDTIRAETSECDEEDEDEDYGYDDDCTDEDEE